jgi:choline dehydrogenase
MAHQSWKRSGLGLPGSTESSSERTLYSREYGQGPGWWVQHQCDGLARGRKNDWDYFASEAGDPAWSYESVLNIYRRIEDWHGAPDPKYRGTGGPVFVQPGRDPSPIALAMLEGTSSVGIPTFENQNGRMMEGAGGCSLFDLRVRDGKRQSVFRSYTFPGRI